VETANSHFGLLWFEKELISTLRSTKERSTDLEPPGQRLAYLLSRKTPTLHRREESIQDQATTQDLKIVDLGS